MGYSTFYFKLRFFSVCRIVWLLYASRSWSFFLGYSFILIGIYLLIWFIFGVDEFFIFYVLGRTPITVSKELTEMGRFVRELYLSVSFSTKKE